MALIILAHPNIEHSKANKAIIERLQSFDLPDLEVRHIQRMYPDFLIDVNAEQDALLRHQTIVFQYPFYWYNMPAILKHWFDEVFTYRFAYGSQGDKLKDKYFVPSFTVGAPQHEYSALGEHHFRVLEFCKNLEQTAYYAQMRYMDPFYFHGTSLAAGYAEADIIQKAKHQAEKLKELLLTLP